MQFNLDLRAELRSQLDGAVARSEFRRIQSEGETGGRRQEEAPILQQTLKRLVPLYAPSRTQFRALTPPEQPLGSPSQSANCAYPGMP